MESKICSSFSLDFGFSGSSNFSLEPNSIRFCLYLLWTSSNRVFLFRLDYRLFPSTSNFSFYVSFFFLTQLTIFTTTVFELRWCWDFFKSIIDFKKTNPWRKTNSKLMELKSDDDGWRSQNQPNTNAKTRPNLKLIKAFFFQINFKSYFHLLLF